VRYTFFGVIGSVTSPRAAPDWQLVNSFLTSSDDIPQYACSDLFLNGKPKDIMRSIVQPFIV
jgi:hypothetical protein